MPESIKTSSGVSETGTPLVQLGYGEKELLWSPNYARQMAHGLFQAAAIAESEAVIMDLFSEPKEAVKILLVLRKKRAPLCPGLNPIYGMRSRQPIIECRWFRELLQLEPSDARAIAFNLLNAAESAEYDAFSIDFLEGTLNLAPEKIADFLSAFLLFKSRNNLEELHK